MHFIDQKDLWQTGFISSSNDLPTVKAQILNKEIMSELKKGLIPFYEK